MTRPFFLPFLFSFFYLSHMVRKTLLTSIHPDYQESHPPSQNVKTNHKWVEHLPTSTSSSSVSSSQCRHLEINSTLGLAPPSSVAPPLIQQLLCTSWSMRAPPLPPFCFYGVWMKVPHPPPHHPSSSVMTPSTPSLTNFLPPPPSS